MPVKNKKEGNVLFNGALDTFYLLLHSVGQIVKNHSDSKTRTLLPLHGYFICLPTRVRLYASSHKQDNTYHDLCYTSHGTLAGTRNSSMGPSWGIDPMTHHTMTQYERTLLGDSFHFFKNSENVFVCIESKFAATSNLKVNLLQTARFPQIR